MKKWHILILVAWLMCGCDKYSDTSACGCSEHFVFINQTGYHISIESYDSQLGNSVVELCIGQSYSDVLPDRPRLEQTPVIIESDSVRLVFNRTKELWLYNATVEDNRELIYKRSNYKKSKNSDCSVTTYKYQLDKSLYDRAVEIEK